MLIVIIVILSLLLGASVLANVRSIKKIEEYEDYCSTLKIDVNRIMKDLKSIDSRGAFETDDEVGLIFSAIKRLISKLEDYA